MNPTYSELDILISSEWILVISYNIKTGPLWLDKGMVFKNIKDILKGIYSNVKKGTRYIV